MGLGVFDTLIFPVWAIIKTPDYAATYSAGGYDDVFREPKLVDSDGDGIGESEMQQSAEIRIQCQHEKDRGERLMMAGGGDKPNTSVELVLSHGDLISLGIVDADGRPSIHINSRLLRLEEEDGTVLYTYNRPPGGLYCTEFRPADAWLGNTLNFFIVRFEDRPAGGQQ